ncbi:MAG TPA: type II toxin-antitoxin system HicB family antitoxin [Rhizorhapis sp.]
MGEIMTLMTYQGYTASVEFDADDMILVGRLTGIDDNISFHADDNETVIAAFHEAVDDYLETCAKIGNAPLC